MDSSPLCRSFGTDEADRKLIQKIQRHENQHQRERIPGRSDDGGENEQDDHGMTPVLLKEFPVTELDFYIPKWLEILPPDHWLKAQVIQTAAGLIRNVDHMKDVSAQLPDLENSPIRSISIRSMRMSDGRVELSVEMDESYYYQILSDYVGLPIEGEYQLMQTLGSLARMQREYEKVRNALAQVRLKGYGVVTPERSEIVLDEPQMIRHGNKYGVKMKAEAQIQY